MHIAIGRRSRLAALSAGLITAAAVAISSSAPALADTADTGGTATLTIPQSFLVGLAKSNIILLPGAGATSAYTAGTTGRTSSDAFTFTVTGGTGEVGNFSGVIELGGSLVLINAQHSQTVTITGLELDFYTASLKGFIGTATKRTAIAYTGGVLSSDSSAGPPATESFSASQLAFSSKAASALNMALTSTAFKKAVNLGGFATTFDVTIT
jgi:hypothetical protein